MSRFYSPISLDELKNKIQPIIEYEEDESGDEEFPYNLPKKVEKDIKKIQFDFENWEVEDDGYMNYPCGYKLINPDFPVLFVNAGGDWETPICFIIYWDGKDLRGYVPSKGNVFNPITKTAFGSDEESDNYTDTCVLDGFKKKLNEVKPYLSSEKYIENLDFIKSNNENDIYNMFDSLSNSDAIIDDIKERILKK